MDGVRPNTSTGEALRRSVQSLLDLALQAFDPRLGASLALVPVAGLDGTAADLLLAR